MFVSDWMTRKVVAVEPTDSIGHAYRLVTSEGFRHLPVVKDEQLKGILSDLDIQAWLPSKAKAMAEDEINDLLDSVSVKDAMTQSVITATPQTPVEKAAFDMHEHDIGCLPVVEGGRLVGILTEQDIFRAFAEATGVRQGGQRLSVAIEDNPSALKAVTDIVRKYGFELHCLFTSTEGVKKGQKRVVIRTRGQGDFQKLRMELEATYNPIHLSRS